MAAPIDTGRTAKQALIVQVTMAVAPTARPPRATTAPSTASAAAEATQRSCWRSTPWARRKRTTSEAAPTTTARVVNARASWLTTSSSPP
jgi:hypothetical protein